jgi:integrase/recombinase XerC
MEIEKFIQYINEERRFSPHTLAAYAKDLEQFGNFLREQYNITSFTEANFNQIRSWLVYLLNSGDSNKTINRKLSVLKSFYRFCKANDYIKTNPATRVSGPRTAKSLPVFVEERKIISILTTETILSFEQIRDFLIIHLLYVTGMRRSELLQMKLENFNSTSLTINVLGKRNKERIVPVSISTVEIYENYMKFRNEIQIVPGYESFLFLTAKGKPIDPRVLYRMINSKLKKVSTQQHLGPHALRHTFATHMLDNGADLNAIKEILGHASLAATQVYTHNTVEKLKKIYKQAHPRA